MALNCAVQALAIAAYAARLAGARSGRVATAISLFNIFATSSRFAQMLYTPMLGALSDRATAVSLGVYQMQLRGIIIAGTVGAVIGTLAIPTFVMFYLRAIARSNATEAFPRRRSRCFARLPSRPSWARSRLAWPRAGASSRSSASLRTCWCLNVMVTAVYGVGIVAAAYASVLQPQAARTAVLSSGLVNGFATIAYNIIVDPASALITDRAVRGERTIDDVKALVTGLSVTSVIGLIASQLILLPAASIIEIGAKVISGR